MKIRLINDIWYSNLLSKIEAFKAQQATNECLDNNDNDSQSDVLFDEEYDDFDFYQDRDDGDSDCFGYTILEEHRVPCFDSGGEKMLCLPHVLELIVDNNLAKIKATIEKLGIILTDCNSLKLEILHHNHIIQSKARHCGLISQSNAERLCKIFKSSQTKSNDSNQIISKKYFIPLKYRHQIRVVHDCFGQQKGILMPQLCTNVDAQCIECFDCGVWFSPSEFVGHTHTTQNGLDSEMSTCHWGFMSSNWRLYLRLAEDPSRTAEEEKSLNDYLTEIKNRYIQPAYDSLTICNDHDQQTPSDSCSFNTSPSMPTPTSLSPSDGLNKIDLQNSSSIFQQCIMRICNHHLDNSDDRNQILNTLFMLRQEHHQQISTLISERHELMRALKKSPTRNISALTFIDGEEPKSSSNHEVSVNCTLQSVKDKIAILKQSETMKRKHSYSNQKLGMTNEKIPKMSKFKDPDFNESNMTEWDNNQSLGKIIDCDSSSATIQLTEISCDQRKEMKND